MNEVILKAEAAQKCTPFLSAATSERKNRLLKRLSEKLMLNMSTILEENFKDAERARQNNVSDALIDRLSLTEERLTAIASSVRLVTELEDPAGKVLWESVRPNGLKIKKVSAPLGVIGMIYEARPNVTIDASVLALKTGNAVLLRGSTSTIHSNKAITAVIQEALEENGFPKESVQLIEDPDRNSLNSLYTMKGLIDVLIPRGGKGLIDTVVANAKVPVLETGAGNCHIYIDKTAAPETASEILVNAKTQRPSVCNACETVIIHKEWAERYFTNLCNQLKKAGVTLKGDKKAQSMAPQIEQADEKDFAEEFLDLTLAVKIAENIDEALAHISKYGTKHSESIISEDGESVERFFNNVDASTVYHNASTRFTDGFEFGFGAEIGISTQKLHARGPMGLEALTTYKYHVLGEGQIKE